MNNNKTKSELSGNKNNIQKLSDRELVSQLNKLLGNDQRIEVDLLMHICEVDRRKIYRERAYSSMFKFCIQELHLEEAVAYKRITVARAARKFPQILEAISQREIHLTGACKLAPHLTAENVEELILKATHKSKREIEKLLAAWFPKPDVKSQIRKLPDIPKLVHSSSLSAQTSTPPIQSETSGELVQESFFSSQVSQEQQGVISQAAAMPLVSSPAVEQPASRRDLISPLSSSRYKVQFTADAKLTEKINEAQDLLGTQIARGDLAELFEQSLDVLIARLKNKKHGVTSHPHVQHRAQAETKGGEGERGSDRGSTSSDVSENRRSNDGSSVEVPKKKGNKPSRSRYIPRSVRRQVYERDGGQCAYVSPNGNRCSEKSGLEYHHRKAFGLGGGSTAENLEVRCKCHNLLAAEQDFGAEKMAKYTNLDKEVGADDFSKGSADSSLCCEQRVSYHVASISSKSAWPESKRVAELDPDLVIPAEFLRRDPFVISSKAALPESKRMTELDPDLVIPAEFLGRDPLVISSPPLIVLQPS